MYAKLARFLAPAELQTMPQPEYRCELSEAVEAGNEEAKVPKLLRAYLTIGAQICGPPALDRQFRTVDFLTLLDMARMPKGLFSRATSGLQ